MTKIVKNPYTYIEWTLASGEVRELALEGTFLTILSNSALTDAQIGLGDNIFQAIPAGISIEFPADSQFERLMIKNPSIGAMTLKLAVSFGRIWDNRVVFAGSISVEETPNVLSTPANVTVTDVATLLSGVDATKREMIIQNNGTEDFYIGAVGVTFGTGTLVESGNAIILEQQDAVYAICDTGKTSTASLNISTKV